MARKVPKEDCEIVLCADGTWLQKGSAITHPNMVQYYHSMIRFDEDAGEYYLLQTHGQLEQHVYFEVEDTAYFVEEVKYENDHIEMRLNDTSWERLDPASVKIDNEVLYCMVKEKHRARFKRTVQQDFMPRLEENNGKYTLSLDDVVLEFPSLE